MKIKQGKMRILLACADESLLKQTKRLMQASNELELVGCTSNGTKAWEMIRQKTPDMVVLDTDLPYADGFAVASWMRQNKMWDTSIILLSSFIGGQTYVECSLLHINVLLRKPICADALYERIKLAVTCTSRGDTVEQRLAQILRELGASRRSANSVHCRPCACIGTNGASITKIIYHGVAAAEQRGNVSALRYAVHRAWISVIKPCRQVFR
ncbi:MAG: response regulator [Butyricicoccus sp.]